MRYRVISPLTRNGKRHEIDSTVDLDGKTAADLLGHTVEGPLRGRAPGAAAKKVVGKKRGKKATNKTVSAEQPANGPPPVDGNT